MKEKIIINDIQVLENEGNAIVSIPGYGEVEVRVFKEDTKGFHLIAIPELAWCCKVKYYNDFSKSLNDSLYLGDFTSMGDLQFTLPGLNDYEEGLKLLFSYLIGQVVKQILDKKHYSYQINNIHLEHCEQKLKVEGINISEVFTPGVEKYELSRV